MARKKYITNELGEKKKNKQDIIQGGMKPQSFKFGTGHNNPVYFPKPKH